MAASLSDATGASDAWDSRIHSWILSLTYHTFTECPAHARLCAQCQGYSDEEISAVESFPSGGADGV